ncbi:hypothetical protein KIW84_011152 [Lathyrus oleraceus]|uniref:Uncharacterized protein n=1 Tax=Pisum sativum TaxID=3888 RepID=A0A9D4YNP9_PEA|nr:hypothetical protein KIW84_011152 [Pisum sativum]
MLDTVDITDPSLVSIGDEAVISEGVLVQSHEVKNGILSLHPIRIGWNSSIGPYAVIQKGSVVKEGAEIQPLQKVEGDQHVLKPTKLNNVKEDAGRAESMLLFAWFRPELIANLLDYWTVTGAWV